MARVGFDPTKGRIKTTARVTIDRSFLAHVEIDGDDAPALGAAGILPLTNLGEAIQAAVSPAANPAVPRALSIVSNKVGISGNVVITGTNYAGEEITETLALNGTTTRNGAKAFRDISSISLPVQTNTPVKQVETATASGTATEDADEEVTVTSALFEEDEVVVVAIADEDTAAEIAGKIRVALAANAVVSEHFDVSGETTAIIFTAKLPAANDATLNIAIAGDVAGVDAAASSADTTAGVDFDKVSVGWNDILGLPYQLAHNTVLKAYLNNTLEGTDPTVVVNADDLESNTIKLNSSLDGNDVDIYLIV